MQDFDYIIVGGGTAGCLLANRLSANAQTSVLLLEAGPEDRSPLIKLPIGFGLLYEHKQLNWCLKSEPEPQLHQRLVDQPRGRVLGGSSAINGMLYVRGQPEDFDHWAALGNAGWCYHDVLPYFLKHQRQTRGSSQWHNSAGEWPVEDARYRPRWAQQYLHAANQAGIPTNPDINGADQRGIDFAQVNQGNGTRYSAAHAFLHPIKQRSNLTLLASVQVAKICFQQRRAIGVEAIHNGVRKNFTCRGEVIVAAGALHSPQLLMLSGIGPATELKRRGIEVVHELPGVGQNLQEHLGVDVVYEALTGVTLRDEVMPHRMLKHIVNYLLFKRGLLTFYGPLVSGFVHTSGDFSLRPNCQLVFSPAAIELTHNGRRTKIIRGLTSMAYPLRPDARGSISLASNSISDAPIIRHGFLSTERDCREIIDAVRLQRKVFSQSILKGAVGNEIAPGRYVQSDDDILDYVRRNARGCFHPVGSCKMGNDAMAVVDSELRVYGIDGLRVVDGSVMPTITSGNTNAPIAMIAEKAAAMMLESIANQT